MSIVINKNEIGHNLARDEKVNLVLWDSPKTIIYW